MAVLPKLSSGDTKGPASSTDNALARFDGAGGKTLQDSGFIVDDSGYVTSQGVFTELPAGTGVSQGSLYINPASASANETIFGVAKGGAQLFRIDEDGDVEMAGSKVTLFKNVQAGHELHRGAYSRLIIYGLQGVELKHQAGGNAWREVGLYDMALKCGTGWDAQWTLGSNLDQDGVIVKRDVDGDSSYSEAGALLTLQRDVTNVTSEDGNFLECQNAGGTILADIAKDGSLEISAGFGLDVAPQAQQAHIVDADGTLADITTKFNTLLADLEGYGLLASA